MSQLSACFVIPIEDSIESIFTALQAMAKIHQTGKRNASGPVSFMKIEDAQQPFALFEDK